MNTNKGYSLKEMEQLFGVLTFGSALEAERLCQNLSQKEFAKKLGISPQSLCDIEKGRRIPSVRRASKIAAVLEQSAESWISIALSDMVREVRPDLKVSVKKEAS